MSIIRCLCFYAFLATALSKSKAVLPPDAIENMQNNAPEVFLVSVDTVNPTPTTQKCTKTFEVGAEIVRVDRTSLGYSTGQQISFESHTYDRESPGCKGIRGPISPQMLSPGWCGYVYLNAWSIDPATPTWHFELAAESGSLIEQPKSQCEKDTSLLGVPTANKKKQMTGTHYCFSAPDYTCWEAGWHACCFEDENTCPPKPQCDKQGLLGADYCTYAPDYNCWAQGWHSCCFNEDEVCPPQPQCDEQGLLGADYCTHAPDYNCWEAGWHSCCFNEDEVCPPEPQCDKQGLLGADHCTHAPDYNCWEAGWHSCCFNEDEVCPPQPQCDKQGLLGSDYCTHAPDYNCWKAGWHSCCFNDDYVCPPKPQCDAAGSTNKVAIKQRQHVPAFLSASIKKNARASQNRKPGYCHYAPDYKCYQFGWDQCCLDSASVCPKKKPTCDIQPARKTAYCTYAPDYHCWRQGWPDCCMDDSRKSFCPTTKPQCDNTSVLPGTDYCNHGMDDFTCYERGWPKCCLDPRMECPAQKPGCDVVPPGGRKLRGFTGQ